MGEKSLVESLIHEAIALIQKMDDTPTPITFAAWYYYDDAEEWRLLIAANALDSLLPKQEAVAYRKVIDVLSTLTPEGLSVSDLKLVATSYPLLQAMRLLVATGPHDTARVHFKDCMFNGIFIKEVLILRSA